MSNADLKSTDHSNTIVQQNPENASVVSVFPLVDNQPLESENTRSVTANLPSTSISQTVGGGSNY